MFAGKGASRWGKRTSGARWWDGVGRIPGKEMERVIIILVVERSEAGATYGNDGTNSVAPLSLRGQCSELLWLFHFHQGNPTTETRLQSNDLIMPALVSHKLHHTV